MKQPPAVWNGSEAEALALQEACAHNCTCTQIGSKCGGHALMLGSQQELDRLIFARRIEQLQLDEEFAPVASGWDEE